MRWGQGREAIDGMLTRGELERVPASRAHADVLLTQARRHLASAGAIAATDPAGAYQLLYDAARKALAAVLENEGMRATSRGGHIAVRDAVSSQLDPPLGAVLRPFDRLRRPGRGLALSGRGQAMRRTRLMVRPSSSRRPAMMSAKWVRCGVARWASRCAGVSQFS